MEVKVGISNRHVHLTKEDLEILYGKDYILTPRNYLDQPGQFAAEEIVTLKTNKNIKEHVRIVGPPRTYTQVELLEEDKDYFGIRKIEFQDREEYFVGLDNDEEFDRAFDLFRAKYNN